MDRIVQLILLPQTFSVCKLNAVPDALPEGVCFLARTDLEVSLVCETRYAPANATARADDWRAMRVQGSLDFSLIGILAGLADCLAKRRVSIFAISTYDTDTLLVRAQALPEALRALTEDGYTVAQP